MSAVFSSATPDGVARTNAAKEARWGDAIRKEGLVSALHPKWYLRADDGKPAVIVARVRVGRVVSTLL